MLTLQTPCFFVEKGEIREAVIGDFHEFIEGACRPDGVGHRYHVRQLDEQWALAEWAFGKEQIISLHDDEEEADALVESIQVADILNNMEICIFVCREDAEKNLEEQLLEDVL